MAHFLVRDNEQICNVIENWYNARENRHTRLQEYVKNMKGCKPIGVHYEDYRVKGLAFPHRPNKKVWQKLRGVDNVYVPRSETLALELRAFDYPGMDGIKEVCNYDEPKVLLDGYTVEHFPICKRIVLQNQPVYILTIADDLLTDQIDYKLPEGLEEILFSEVLEMEKQSIMEAHGAVTEELAGKTFL